MVQPALFAATGKAILMDFTPLEVLDQFIAHGWGNTPQDRIPSDWRNIPGPDRECRRISNMPEPSVKRRKVRRPREERRSQWENWMKARMEAVR